MKDMKELQFTITIVIKNVAEERAFIPVSESFEFLKKDLEKLSYVNEKNELFLILAKNLYRINIEENSSEILEKGIKNAILYLPIIMTMQPGWFQRG